MAWPPEVRERCLAMCREGHTLSEITEATGVPLATVSGWLNDPDGSRQRARKDSYRGVCEDCGAPTDGSNGPGKAPRRCNACTRRREHESRIWTREAITAAIRAWAEEYGAPPKAVEWHAGVPGFDPERYYDGPVVCPSLAVVRREFGTFNTATIAAGFEPTPATGPPPGTLGREDYERTVSLVDQHGVTEAARRLRISPSGVYQRLYRARDRYGLERAA